ncbi:Nuclear valosin-containing protein-like, partial [Sarcoptes scabiei]
NNNFVNSNNHHHNTERQTKEARKLYQRLKTILSNQNIYDIESLIESLKKSHPEYRRQKRLILQKSVRKCIEKIQKDNGIADLVVANEIIEDSPQQNFTPNNSINNSLNDLYNKNKNNQKRPNVSVDKGERKKFRSDRKHSDKQDKNIEATLQKHIKSRNKYLVDPKVSFDDFGGIDDVIEEIKRLMFHIKNADLYRRLGIESPKGFLLHGPPGVGKSLLVEALAKHLQISYLKCGATEIVAGISGESEEKLRQLFALAKEHKPCLIFIDEIDAITPKRENATKEMERRIVTQLISCIDDLSATDGSSDGIMIIGATNRPDSLDPALRRAGRFDREIALGIPSEKSRLNILKILLRKIELEPDFDLQNLAHKTPGYVGADLKNLIREASVLALERLKDINSKDDHSVQEIILDENAIGNFRLQMLDFDMALKKIQPSSKREGFATVPDVTWNDIGALSKIRQELQISILAPVRFADDVEKLGLSLSVGILLCGPPGCGKTLLAKAIANESGINFISVKGPELLNMYVGESERAVRAIFTRARVSKPCVIFFDEIDALCPKRTDSESSNVTSRVVNQLLTEMDGLESRDCFLLAATNRPDILDPALLRPGRFDKTLYVGFPTPEDRFEILLTLTKKGTKPPISSDVNLKSLATDERLDGFTGADLSALVRETSLIALKEKINGIKSLNEPIILNDSHFNEALTKIKPSVTKESRLNYQIMEQMYGPK